ncbi:GNAT family N-acetyltransferase [Maribius pontilimi]|uniref:GNAT family N-acetyltransferase n=1 Tax=Palleronia pontilimi TaxID=1964209 RepID=A0A934ICT7_9RHOB|nr:GNAT family N-acetyltransferase [Palleronia pontilimi]MBJ3763296.1 GNAT family N-acetyltransferase [Palleronia pontilimi]
MTRLIAVTEDVETCRALRRAVFIEEQHISEADEWDDLDADALHLLARENGLPVGTARIFIEGDTGKIGRVCVLATQRGSGLGRDLMEHALDVLRKRDVKIAKLGAQLPVLEFYRALGFEAEGPIYDDAGIPHRDMTRAL